MFEVFERVGEGPGVVGVASEAGVALEEGDWVPANPQGGKASRGGLQQAQEGSDQRNAEAVEEKK